MYSKSLITKLHDKTTPECQFFLSLTTSNHRAKRFPARAKMNSNPYTEGRRAI